MRGVSVLRAVSGWAVLAMLVTGCASSGSASRKRPLYDSPAAWEPATARGAGSTRASGTSTGTMLFGETRVVEQPVSAARAPGAPSARRPVGGAAAGARSGAPAVGIDAAGQVVTTGDFRGRIVVLDFWATWCGPCKASSPAFQQLSDRFAGDPRVMTLAIHTDGTGDPRGYMREHGYTFRMVPRGQEFAAAYNVNVLPTFIVLDGRGREIYRDTGMMGDTQRAEVERLVRANLR